MAWTATMRWAGQIVSWAATLMAARLLAPGDYGLVAMATLAIGLARMVQDFGLDVLLIQDRTIVGTRQARIAGLIVLVGAALWLVFALLAAPIAWFFGEASLTPVIILISAVFLTDALQVVPRAQMQRALEYDRLAISSFVQLVATQATLLVAVFMGAGYWSLVVNQLAGEIVVTLLLAYWSPWRLAWPGDLRALLGPIRQGGRILATRAAWYGYSNADQIIIGRFLGKDALGTYSFATTFSSVTQQEIGSVVSKVAPGIFSAVQDDRGELRRYFLGLTEFLAVLSFPALIGLALTADLVVPRVLGPQWDGVIVPLQLLCLYATFLASQTLVSHVLLWTGQFRVYMWCAILAGVGMPLAFLAGVQWGLSGIGWTWVVAFPILSAPSLHYAFRTMRITTLDWVVAMRPALVSCAVMGIAVFGAREFLPLAADSPVRLALVIAAGGLGYGATMIVVFRARITGALRVFRQVRAGEPLDLNAMPGATAQGRG